ncbi:MAG: hypothetical protein NVSMB14_10780 [Isosphaeraceae bacterium]
MIKTGVTPQSVSSSRSESTAVILERIAWLMDRAVKVPGTKVTFGLDALLGILPIGGDVLTGIVQAGLVLVALRHYKVPKSVAAQMMSNVLLDIAVGAIPILGDLFDLSFKANTRNMKLLEPYRTRPDIGVRDVDFSVSPAPSSLSAAPATSIGGFSPIASRGMSWRFLLPIGFILFSALALMLVGFVTIVAWLLKH